MNLIEKIRKSETSILVVGNHEQIVQSILDFDYLSQKKKPSIKGLVTSAKKVQKCFFGKKELLLPCFSSIEEAKKQLKHIDWLLNLQSGRRAFNSTISFFEQFSESEGAHIFAENVPEKHALTLIAKCSSRHLIVGPSGVGLLVPKSLKLGAIGGIDAAQIKASALTEIGNIAVISTSGGMTNELIRTVAFKERRVSFALAIGGDRFPVTSLTEAFSLAEEDKKTDAIVYFGELGGVDEYEIVDLLEKKKLNKPVFAYIAGAIDEEFKEHMQFGHAKALVRTKAEGASAKRLALRAVGVTAPETYSEFLDALSKLPLRKYTGEITEASPLMNRDKSILSTRELLDVNEIPQSVSRGKLVKSSSSLFIEAALFALLGKKAESPITLAFTDAIFAHSVDHGGNVSGAVNTMITARAGKDLVSSLAAGLLTIGPRFGGAVNEAAENWHASISKEVSAAAFVESLGRLGKPIAGIGHKKYRVGLPDPRVQALQQFAPLLKKHPHFDFALQVEKITTAKVGSLILNIDGTIAALLLDILSECEQMSKSELQNLIDAELFNAFFVIPRTVGFIGHFLEQKQNDEGLFRLPDELLYTKVQKKAVSKKPNSSKRKKR